MDARVGSGEIRAVVNVLDFNLKACHFTSLVQLDGCLDHDLGRKHGCEVVDGESLTVKARLSRLEELDNDVRVEGVPRKLFEEEFEVLATDTHAHFVGLASRVV